MYERITMLFFVLTQLALAFSEIIVIFVFTFYMFALSPDLLHVVFNAQTCLPSNFFLEKGFSFEKNCCSQRQKQSIADDLQLSGAKINLDFYLASDRSNEEFYTCDFRVALLFTTLHNDYLLYKLKP
jgi:hypothetical protein